MSLEVAVVVDDAGEVLQWHAPPGRSATHIPDSGDLWTCLWLNVERLGGVAHSHPGGGLPSPSTEDVTTFSACELGLGRRIKWWITSRDRLVECCWRGPGPYDYDVVEVVDSEAPQFRRWIGDLRRRGEYHDVR